MMPTRPHAGAVSGDAVPLVDIVLVTWNNRDQVPRCLARLAAADRTTFTIDRIAIVDNASTDDSRPAAPVPGLPAPTHVANDRNGGFAQACNQGASGSRADFIVFLNPDIDVAPTSLAEAVAFLAAPAFERCAIAGLPLANARGVTQRTCGRFPTVATLLAQVTGASTMLPRLAPGFRLAEWPHDATRRVDYVSAACLIVRRGAFEAVGGFDPAFIVYFEDIDLALRAREQGWETWFLAAAPVQHGDGWASGRQRPHRLALAWWSRVVYARKHFAPRHAALIAAAVLGMAPIARMCQAGRRGSLRDIAGVIDAYRQFCRRLAADRRHRVDHYTQFDRYHRGRASTPPTAAANPATATGGADSLEPEPSSGVASLSSR